MDTRNLDSFTQQRGQDPSIKEREDNFAKLAKIAEFDPAYLNTHRDDYETRAQILNRAGALVTGEIRRRRSKIAAACRSKNASMAGFGAS
jgi:hypothetical protein